MGDAMPAETLNREDRARRRRALVINLFIPGAGLVLLRRAWLGLTLALLFSLSAHVVIAGLWIAPMAVPRFVLGAVVVAAVLVWMLTQWLVRVQVRLVLGADARRALVLLRDRAVEAMQAGRYEESAGLIRQALRIDDGDPKLVALKKEIESRAEGRK